MAEAAARNAADPTFESPYTREALEEGLDIPIWEKLLGASFKVGGCWAGWLAGWVLALALPCGRTALPHLGASFRGGCWLGAAPWAGARQPACRCSPRLQRPHPHPQPLPAPALRHRSFSRRTASWSWASCRHPFCRLIIACVFPTLPPLQDGKLELGKLRGGKTDDITVVVAYVVAADEPAPAAQAGAAGQAA